MQNSVHFRHLMYFFYKKGKSPLQAKTKICTVYGEGAVTEANVRKWYTRFKSHNFDPETLEDQISPTSKNVTIKTLGEIDSQDKVNLKDTLEKTKTVNLGGSNKKLLGYVCDKSDSNLSSNAVCGWVTKDPLYISYHNDEWGKPEFDCTKLFEMICLEGQQSGLSWLTILKKREHYRKKFYNFDPHKVAQIQSKEIDEYLNDSGIVRHRGKVEAIVNNANCYIKMENMGENFSEFIWGFVNNSPIINNWETDSEVPAQTETSAALSKALKKRGFKFVGSTTCYAFMQACGLVNDHISSCNMRTEKDSFSDII